MKTTDRSILVGLALVGLIAAFWFVVLSPKREQASALEDQVAALESSVADYESLASAAEEAEAGFDQNYKSLVVLGKAVPSDSDTSSLLIQLGELASDAGVELGGIELTQSAAGAAPPPPPAAETTADSAESEPVPAAEAAAIPAAAPAAPTEAIAATLPLGATVGAAGLPVMPYTLTLAGSFFELAEFLKGVDDLVGFADAKPNVHGRLLTIDGFSLTEPETAESTIAASGDLFAELALTSYVSPAEQGLTAGATPAGPPPATSTPVSTTTPPVAVIP